MVTMNTDEDVTRGVAMSVYMDGELPVEQRDHLLLSLKSDAALRHDWLVYHCIGDALRSEDAVPLTNGFGDRLKTRLEAEPFLFAPEVSKTFAVQRASGAQRWRMPVAVAASVAAVVTAGLLVLPHRDGAQNPQNQQMAQSGTQISATALGGAQPLAAAHPPAGAQPSSLPAAQPTAEIQARALAALPAATLAPAASAGGAQPLPADPALRTLSSEYLMAHRHYSAGLAMRGVVSHVRTAGYDGQ